MDDAVTHIQRRCGIDLEELIIRIVTFDVAHRGGARRLDGQRILAHVHPIDVVDHRAVIGVDAIRTVGADHDVAQCCAILYPEHRILTFVLTAIAQRGAGVEAAAATIERATGDQNSGVHSRLCAVGRARGTCDSTASTTTAATAGRCGGSRVRILRHTTDGVLDPVEILSAAGHRCINETARARAHAPNTYTPGRV